MTRTRTDFAKRLASEMGLSQEDGRHAIDQFLVYLQEYLVAGDEIAFRGICSLRVVQRAAKVGLNPKAPKDGFFLIPPYKAVKLTAGINLHAALNPEPAPA